MGGETTRVENRGETTRGEMTRGKRLGGETSCYPLKTPVIGIAPIMQFMHMRNKLSNIQGRSPSVVKVIFHTKRNCSQTHKRLVPNLKSFCLI